MATRMKFFFTFLIIVAVLASLEIVTAMTKADKKEISNDSIQLIGEFKSYFSINTVESYIRDVLQKESSWKLEGDPNYKSFEPNTSCQIRGYVLEEYSHLGFIGKLRFTFLDDRLISTEFCPRDYQTYLNSFLKTQSLKFKITKMGWKEAQISANTRVAYTTLESVNQYGGNFVIIWEDVRLSKELSNCLYKD